MQKENMVIEDFVDELLDTPNISEEIENKGTKYQRDTTSRSPGPSTKIQGFGEYSYNETEFHDICPARQL